MQTTRSRPVTAEVMDITFRREMLGWIGAVHFTIEPIPDANGLFAVLRCNDPVRLRSGAEVPELKFLVTAPGVLWPQYQVALDEEFAESLDLVVPDDAALLAIVTPRDPLERTTVNLFSPVIVNRHTGVADQFVPAAAESEVGWHVRTPMPLPASGGEPEGGPDADAHP
ncbi:MAG: flagellar assembly protein FliW [Acidimicrobiales bacterium]